MNFIYLIPMNQISLNVLATDDNIDGYKGDGHGHLISSSW
jgi:hypothetical protein